MRHGGANILVGLRVWLALAAGLGCVGRAKGLDRNEVTDLFSQGKELFRQANERVGRDPEGARELYRKAAMRFERIVTEGGLHNGRLYYNIGNAYFRIQDLGRAILNYRRAEQFVPNDVNLQQNLDYARARRLDKVEEPAETRVLKTLLFWHYDLSAGVRSGVFVTAFGLVWLLAAARLFLRSGTLTWLISIGALVALLMLGSLVAEAVWQHRHRPGVMIAAEVVARQGDSETFEPSFTAPLHAGTEFTLLENRGAWCHVQLVDNRTCWVPAGSVELVR